MKRKPVKEVHIVHCHAAGEVGDVVVSGIEPPPGETVWEQSRYLHDDRTLRNFLLKEPRGGVFRHVNLLVPPRHPDAVAAFIIMEPADTPPMSGSNSMCVAKVLLEQGLLPMTEPETRLLLEAPGGLVYVSAECRDGSVGDISIGNLPSFADRLGVPLDVDGVGKLTVDTAFGGDSFVICDASEAEIAIDPANARALASAGMRITQAANEQIGFSHPTIDGLTYISFCLFADPIRRDGERLFTRHAVAIRPGKIDRSPTGTGVSARMAVLHARGAMQAGDSLNVRSIIDSRFRGRIDSTTRIADRTAIVPLITGQAHVYGTSRWFVDPADPYPQGYRLNDTWPEETPAEPARRA